MLSQPKPSSQLSRYRILGLVGQGQFGQVFCAMHRRTGQLFALKNLEQDRFPTHQFLRELRFLLSLQHPNIVTCQTIEHTQTGRYLVMDYCEGGTLRSLMGDEVALPLAQCIQIVADVLCGLSSAHQQGIVHCDIKPENILLTLQAKGWMAKISDFGIARLNQEVYSQSTGNTGSPAYMAPERFYSQYSAASDIYAVGVLLFELLVGYRPFVGTPKALMEAHLNQPIVCPDEIPAGLQGVIGRALQKLPARRFQSAMEMLDAMLSVVAKMDGVLERAMSLESPLLMLRQEIPYYDSDPQIKEVSKHAINALGGLFLPPLRSDRQPIGSSQIGSSQIGPSQIGPSFMGYTGSTHFTYRAIAPIHNPNEMSTLKGHRQGWRSLQLPDPIQQLLPAPQGYFFITRNTIYWVDPLVLDRSNTASVAPPSASTTPVSAQPIYTLDQACIAAIEPRGHWVALVTDFRKIQPQNGTFSTLSFHPLPRRSGSMALPQHSMRLQVAGRAKRLLKAIALDIRHVAIISDGPPPNSKQPNSKQPNSKQILSENDADPSSERTNPRPPLPKTMDRATYIEVFTRRGHRIALQYLPICLGTVITTPKPYRLLATDQYDPTSLLCIDLKPFRIQRFALDIHPQFLAATNWGYIAADVQGNIVFLDTSGDAVSALHGPANLTAITFLAPQFLFLSTWKDGTGFLYTLDLKQQMTHWVF